MRWVLYFLPQPVGDVAGLVRAIDELPQIDLLLPWRLSKRTATEGRQTDPLANAVDLS